MKPQTSITPVQNTQANENALRQIIVNALAEEAKSDPKSLTPQRLQMYPELLDMLMPQAKAPTPVSMLAPTPAAPLSVPKQPATAPVVMQNSLSARIAAAKSKVSGN